MPLNIISTQVQAITSVFPPESFSTYADDYSFVESDTANEAAYTAAVKLFFYEYERGTWTDGRISIIKEKIIPALGNNPV